MSNKRVKAADAMSGARKKKGSAPNEIIVQRLASEPDSKQTYWPVQPREFVDFQYEDLSLNNLKKACVWWPTVLIGKYSRNFKMK